MATPKSRALIFLAGTVTVLSVLPPQGAGARPSRPSIRGVTITAATHNSVTATVSGHAARYRLYVARTRPGLAADTLVHDAHSPWSTGPTVTVSGLVYSAKPYFYRVYATSGSRHAYSAIAGPVSLRPSTPTGLAESNAIGGALSLTWSPVTGTGYKVAVATDAAMTQSRRTYKLIGPDVQFSPPGLAPGRQYYFTVAAMNASTTSAPSAAVSGSTAAHGRTISTMTYNIREASLDSQPDGSNQGEPWSQRRAAAAALITQGAPDVVAVQEAASYVGGSTTVRQIDDLVNALGGSYRLARTEIPPTEAHYFRTADYILYNPNVLTADDPAGAYPAHDYWDIGESSAGHNHWAAYQEFTDIATGAKFLFVCFHLQVPNNDDQIRENQTNSMLDQASALGRSLDVPVVYAGDTNSAVETSHAFDGPRLAMQARNVVDAFDVAASRSNTKYDSANNFSRVPPAHAKYIDGVFLSPGVAALSWKLLLDLSGGRFVSTIPSDHNPLLVDVVIPY